MTKSNQADVVYEGAMCSDPSCTWSGDDPAVMHCPRCGRRCRWWSTSERSLIPYGCRYRERSDFWE